MSGTLRIAEDGSLRGDLVDAFGFITHIVGKSSARSPRGGFWEVTATVTVPEEHRIPWLDDPPVESAG